MTKLSADNFIGVNNLLPDHKLRTKEGMYLRHAVNVDVTGVGTVQRRNGFTKTLAGSDCHSLWTTCDTGYFVDGETLYSVRNVAGGLQKNALLTGLTRNAPVSFADAAGVIHFSNGTQLWRLDGETAVVSGLATPNTLPVLTASVGGSMPAGLYQACVTHLTADGEESGATPPISVEVPENSVLTISHLPSKPGLLTCLYLSSPNGLMLFRHTVGAAGTEVISVLPNRAGAACRTLHLHPLPAGSIVRYLNGRLLVAAGAFLFYSEPFALGLYNPAKNYIAFPEPITLIEPCQNGFYVSADQTYWVSGDIASAELNPVLPYRAVRGTGCQIPNDNRVWWQSERGAIVAGPDGSVVNIQEKTVAVSPALAGASLFREEDGMKQMIASLFSPQQTAMAARSFMDAEIVRKEMTL